MARCVLIYVLFVYVRDGVCFSLFRSRLFSPSPIRPLQNIARRLRCLINVVDPNPQILSLSYQLSLLLSSLTRLVLTDL